MGLSALLMGLVACGGEGGEGADLVIRGGTIVTVDESNPEVQALTIEDLRPVLCLVASARRRYLQNPLRLGAAVEAGHPDDGQLEDLARRRREFEELAAAAKALETAIQRGYLDVDPGAR